MKGNLFTIVSKFLPLAFLVFALSAPLGAEAHEGHRAVPHFAPEIQEASGGTGHLADVPVLGFNELFVMPVGPYGLEVTDVVKALAGKQVQMRGYMALEGNPVADRFVLLPMPAALGGQEESLVDDIPPGTVFVRMPSNDSRLLPFLPGLLRVSGTFEMGSVEELDGRVSAFRIVLDPSLADAFSRATPLVRSTQHQE